MDAQEIRFTQADGRRVAWASSGAGPPLVLAGWWMSHLELNWQDPAFRAFVDDLGRHRTVIRYDAPGTGLSADGGAPHPTVDGELVALAAVIEAAGAASGAAPGAASGAAPVDLFAASSGAPVGLAYAAARPERVERLVVYGGYGAGASIASASDRAAMVALVRDHWSLGSRVLADVFMPTADGRARDRFVAFQRAAASAEEAARSLEAAYAFDVSDRLADVTAPAVVLHRRDDRAIPFALGRELAASLPHASMVALDGADHFPWLGDAHAVLRAVRNALALPGEPAATPVPDATPAPRASAPAADAAAPADAQTRDAHDELTARETEVLALIAAGLSDKEIAARLHLSPHTVHRHVANVRTKLRLPTRAAAVAAAARRGLL